jgi:hypothetical protein
MWPPGSLLRWPADGAPGSAPAGPATTTLVAVTARTAAAIRCVAIACLVVQVVIWHSFYAADPWRIAGPLAAVLWAAVVVFGLARRSPGWKLAVSDCCFCVALALGAMWCVPPAMRGDTANWLYIMLAAQVVVPAWYAPTAVFVPLALASGWAYWAGTALFPAGSTANTAPAAACALLMILSAVSDAAPAGRHRGCRPR